MLANQVFVNDGGSDTCVTSLSVIGIGENLPLPHYIYPLYIQWGACWSSRLLDNLFGPDVANIICQYSKAVVSLLPFGNIESASPRSRLDASLVFSETYRVQELRAQTYAACSHLQSPTVLVRLDQTLARDQPPQLRVDKGKRIGVDIEACVCSEPGHGHALVTMYLVPA
jgi:hypothetical protein